MQLNLEKLKNLMKEQYDNNYHTFAKALGFDVSALHRILNGQLNAGLKTINKIIAFLKTNKLEVQEYIFLH